MLINERVVKINNSFWSATCLGTQRRKIQPSFLAEVTCRLRQHFIKQENAPPCLLPAGCDGRSNKAIVAAENSSALTWP